MRTQLLLQRVQRHPAFFDLDDAVGPPEQAEAAPGVGLHAVLGLPPVGGVQVRGGHRQAAVLDAPGHAGQRVPLRLLGTPLPPGDAAGFAAAEYLGGGHAKQCPRLQRGVFGQRTARGKHRAQLALQRGPVQLFGQALEVGRGGHQHRRLPRQRTDQVLMEEPARLDGTTGGQRPQHAEQQAIDMLVRDRAVHLRAFQLVAEGGLQRIHFARELAHALDDRARRAGAAGGEHHQLQLVFVQRQQVARDVGVGSGLQRGVVRGYVTGKPVHARAQRVQRGRQVVAAQEHPLAGVPGTQQRGGKGQGVVEVQRPVVTRRTGERPLPAQHLFAEVGVRHRAMFGFAHDPAGPWRHRQPVQCDPVNHARAPPSPVAAPATRHQTRHPSSRTPTIRCTAPRPGWTPTAP